jgi:hypothetical protein
MLSRVPFEYNRVRHLRGMYAVRKSRHDYDHDYIVFDGVWQTWGHPSRRQFYWN